MKYATCFGCGKALPIESDYPGPFCAAECLIDIQNKAAGGDITAVAKVRALNSLRIPLPQSGSDKDPK